MVHYVWRYQRDYENSMASAGEHFVMVVGLSDRSRNSNYCDLDLLLFFDTETSRKGELVRYGSSSRRGWADRTLFLGEARRFATRCGERVCVTRHRWGAFPNSPPIKPIVDFKLTHEPGSPRAFTFCLLHQKPLSPQHSTTTEPGGVVHVDFHRFSQCVLVS